jgi:hypothetical protein
MPTKKKAPAKKVVKKAAKKTAKKTTKKVVRKSSVAAAKKPVKKAAKKAPAKKTKKACDCATACKPEEFFWVNQGPVVGSIADLRNALSSMSDDQYTFHTKRDGNDFARWVRDCHGNKECAKKLAAAKSRAGAVRVLAACNGSCKA